MRPHISDGEAASSSHRHRSGTVRPGVSKRRRGVSFHDWGLKAGGLFRGARVVLAREQSPPSSSPDLLTRLLLDALGQTVPDCSRSEHEMLAPSLNACRGATIGWAGRCGLARRSSGFRCGCWLAFVGVSLQRLSGLCFSDGQSTSKAYREVFVMRPGSGFFGVVFHRSGRPPPGAARTEESGPRKTRPRMYKQLLCKKPRSVKTLAS